MAAPQHWFVDKLTLLYLQNCYRFKLLRYLFLLKHTLCTQVPLKQYVVELYQLIWQEGVEVALAIIPQQEMGDSFYLPTSRYVFVWHLNVHFISVPVAVTYIFSFTSESRCIVEISRCPCSP